MKRTLPLFFALFLLTACGAPAAAPSASARPSAEPYVEPVIEPYSYLPSSSATDLTVDERGRPKYVPPMDFAPTSVWCAEPFGSDGMAVLFMGEPRDGARPFKLYFSFNSDRFGDFAKAGNLQLYAFVSELEQGRFEYVRDESNADLEMQYIGRIDAGMEISGNRLTIDYETVSMYDMTRNYLDATSASPRVVLERNDTGFIRYLYLPREFTRMDDRHIASAMYQMPVYYEELSFSPNSGETAALYDELGERYTSSDPEYAPKLRGIGIGSSLDDILERIPVEAYMEHDSGTLHVDPDMITVNEGGLRLYGDPQSLSHCAALYYENGRPSDVVITCRYATRVTFHLNADGLIESASFYKWIPW